MHLKTKLYLAYGSNLNLGQMAHRCPDSHVAGKAELLGYRLLFRGRPGNAHATIEQSEGRTVPVLLWKVSVRDEALLDRYEGYPYYYGKVQIPVELDGKTVSAMAYEAISSARHITDRLTATLLHAGPLSAFDRELFQRTVLEIHLTRKGEILLKLQNGVFIGEGDAP